MQLDIFDNIMDNLPYGVYVVDAQGNYIFVNSAYINMVKIPKAELLSYNVFNFKKNKEINICVTEKVCQTKKRVTMFQDVEIKGHCHYKQVIDSNPVFDNNGNIKYIIAICIPFENLSYLYKEATNNEVESFIELPSNLSIELKDIIAVSPIMKNILRLSKTIAKVDTNVLITGESGTGKEVLAKFIHENSNRNSKEMIVINCASLPESLLESELFGYEKGAFTGASSSGKRGLFELADKSTLFLDEINSLPLSLQGKILRAIETKTIRRIGSNIDKKIDFRLIVATNEDLLKLVDENKFRKDLYYRLSIVPINLPPLIERKEDILPLVEYFRDYYCKIYNKHKVFSKVTLQSILNYNWPGNIRELRNFVERSLITVFSDVIEISNVSQFSYSDNKFIKKEGIDIDDEDNYFENLLLENMSLENYLEECEKKYLKYVNKKFQSSYKIAKILKTSQSTIIRKKKKYKID